MKPPVYVAACLMLIQVWCAGHGTAFAADQDRPNIVLIMADDLGYSDLGCYGSEIATPNLDRLAAGGLRLTQFYNCARCCPTRASLMTGLYPHQAGVGNMEGDDGLPGYRGVLCPRCLTIADALKPCGYRTWMAGKWNLGTSRPHFPIDHGFQQYFGLLGGASDYFDPRVGPRARPDRYALNDQHFNDYPDNFYATDAFSEYAASWIDDSAAQGPFFLYLSYTAPHSPLQAHPDDIAKYRGKYRDGWDVLRERRRTRMIERGLLDRTTPLSPRDERVPAWSQVQDQDFEDLKMSVYAAQVECMDRGIGRVIAALERQRVLDNTLILFLSDNGGDGEPESVTGPLPGPKGTSHIYGRPWAQLSNTPLRGYKHQSLEGGIASPLIAHWPARIRQPGIIHQPAHVIDVLPTCLEVAGVDPKALVSDGAVPVAGKSLLSLFETGHRAGHDALYWEHEGNRAVRQGNWKLVGLHGGEWELYDVSVDRIESKNLASANPNILKTMIGLYDDWAGRCGVVPWDQILARKRK